MARGRHNGGGRAELSGKQTKRKFFEKKVKAIDAGHNSGKTQRSAGVAQLVEHPICNRAVGSSSLSTSTTSSCP